MSIINYVRIIAFMFIYFAIATKSEASNDHPLSHKLDLQFRFDDHSDKGYRNQYRIRYYPSLALSSNNSWSLNGFIVSGDKFSSGNTTLRSDSTDYFYARHLFLRYAYSGGKWELGVIPTYKGRVSSSGLSKDGWIKGVRSVFSIQQDNELEFVAGELSDTDAKHALDTIDQVNYAEIEYSANTSKPHSYELGFEHIMGDNFARAEYRWRYLPTHTLFLEIVHSLTHMRSELVAGLSGQLQHNETELYYFAHYSYVSEHFALRAELSEDFLDYGHGISIEVGARIAHFNNAQWFVRTDIVENTSRIMGGIKLRFKK